MNGVVRVALALPGRRTLTPGGIAFAREQGLTGTGAYPTRAGAASTTRAASGTCATSRATISGPAGALSAQLYLSDQRDRIRDPEGELGVGGPRLT